MNYKVVNIIANTDTHIKINLTNFAISIEDTEYEPEIYFALIYRLKNPKCSILINTSGKIIFSGASSLINIECARDIFFDKLRSLGYYPIPDVIKIQNMVVVTDYQKSICLEALLENCRRLTIDCKSSKSRVVVRINAPRFTAAIFRTGKCTITGVKGEQMIPAALMVLNELIE